MPDRLTEECTKDSKIEYDSGYCTVSTGELQTVFRCTSNSAAAQIALLHTHLLDLREEVQRLWKQQAEMEVKLREENERLKELLARNIEDALKTMAPEAIAKCINETTVTFDKCHA